MSNHLINACRFIWGCIVLWLKKGRFFFAMFYLYRFILALILKQGRRRPLDREKDREKRKRDRRERER